MRNYGSDSCIFVDVSFIVFNTFTIYPPRCLVQGSEGVTASLVQGKEGETKIITLVPIHIYCMLIIIKCSFENENLSLKIAVTRTEERQDKALWLTKKRVLKFNFMGDFTHIHSNFIIHVLADDVSACVYFSTL